MVWVYVVVFTLLTQLSECSLSLDSLQVLREGFYESLRTWAFMVRPPGSSSTWKLFPSQGNTWASGWICPLREMFLQPASFSTFVQLSGSESLSRLIFFWKTP